VQDIVENVVMSFEITVALLCGVLGSAQAVQILKNA
jgi:ABC-type enterochelin transport system permease subunit